RLWCRVRETDVMYIDSVPLIETTGRHARHFTQITGALVAALDPLLDLVSQQGHFVVTVPQEWSAEFGELIDQFTLQRWWKRPSRELTPTHAEEFAFIRTSVRELKRLWGMQAKGATCRIGHVLDHLSRSSVMLHGGVMSTPKDVSRAKDNPALLLFIG